MKFRLTFLSILALFLTGSAFTQSAPAQHLQVELLSTIKSNKAKAGQRVQAKTVTPLVLNGTAVPVGSTVLGEVREAEGENPQTHGSSLAIAFDSIKPGHGKEIPLKLTVLAAMKLGEAAEKQKQQKSEASNVPYAGQAQPQMQIINGGPETPHNAPESLERQPSGNASGASNGVAAHAGSVIGMPGVTLEVSNQPGGASTFKSAQKDLKLDSGVQLILSVQQ